MPAVTRQREISLFGNLYPMIEDVGVETAAAWAQKQVIGDFTKDSETPMSSWIIGDSSGGIGIKDMNEELHGNRAWRSTAEIRYRGHNLLPRLATQAGSNPGVSHADIVIEFQNRTYVAFGTDLRLWNNVTSAYGSTLGTLAGIPTDAKVHKDKIYFACGTDFNRYDGSTLTDGATLGSAQPCRYLEEWDDKLFTMDNDGQLDYSIDEGVTWTTNADSKLPSGYFTKLFRYRNAAGERVLHLATKVGLLVLDFDNARWIQTDLVLPFHAFGGLGSDVWRDATYTSAGLSVYEYKTGPPSIRSMGPDRDAGLPSSYRGSITKILAGHNAIFVFIDATSEEEADLFVAGDDEYGMMQFDDAVGSSLIMQWDGIGWSVVYVSTTSALPIKGGVVAAADDIYRLWFGIDREVFFVPLQVSLQNPVEVADYDFAASDEHQTPWFDADNAVVDKTAAILTGYFTDMTATEYAKIYYAVDYDESTWTLLTNSTFTDGQVDADGETEFTFASGAGLNFKAIRFKIEKFRRSGDARFSPDMRWLRLSYLKKLEQRFGFRVKVDCTRNYRHKTAKTLLSTLKSAHADGTLGEFTFKNGSGAETHRVNILDLKGAEVGGRKSEGIFTVTMIAP